MSGRTFVARAETFGLDNPMEWQSSWALPALRLLCHVPRAYAPLVEAFEARDGNVRAGLDRLVQMGFAAHQAGIIVDCRTGALERQESRRVARWRATAKGRKVLNEALEDVRTFEDLHPKATPERMAGVLGLLGAYALEDSHARLGISRGHAVALSGLEERLGRWWSTRFEQAGYIVELEEKLADVREVVPAHWRVNRALMRQLKAVIEGFAHLPDSLVSELRVSRTRFLEDIDPARVGLTGATDFDHDVQAQVVLGAMVRSPRYAGGIFVIEPRLALPCDTGTSPWAFDRTGGDVVLYQPDAELRTQEPRETGRLVNRRVIVEYERFQSRRDGWTHIERFLGWVHTKCLPFEEVVLAFVVDSDQRRRGYVELIEAFADHAMERPELMVPNPVTLAVSSVGRVRGSSDALDLKEWTRITLPGSQRSDTEPRPVLHAPESSPYAQYFGRS